MSYLCLLSLAQKCVKMNVFHVNKRCRQCLVTSGDTVRDRNSTFPMPRGFFRTRNQPTLCRQSEGLLTIISILRRVTLYFYRGSLLSVFQCKTLIRENLVNAAAIPASQAFLTFHPPRLCVAPVSGSYLRVASCCGGSQDKPLGMRWSRVLWNVP